MKKISVIFLIILKLANNVFCQNNLNNINKRVSFIAAIGGSYITEDIYQIPVISKTNNVVIIEKAQNYKTNLTFGICYTPFMRRVISFGDTINAPRGLTFATFISPINLSKTNNSQSFYNMVDFGFGIGYKTIGGFSILGTIEYFSIKQPKDWFVNEYKANDKVYAIDGSTQQSIDINDGSIFKDKSIFTIGIKFCYTFDIIKSYKSINDN
jgi:hypothetical protein